jgi:excisionase family DNA binding protein
MARKKEKIKALDTSIDTKIQKCFLKKDSLYYSSEATIVDIDLLSSEQLCKILDISQATLYALVKTNEIPHFYIGKKILRFHKNSIIEWLQDLEKKAGAA